MSIEKINPEPWPNPRQRRKQPPAKHHPQFIFIEDERTVESEEPRGREETEHFFEQLSELQASWPLRLGALVSGILLAGCCLVAMLLTALTGAGVLATLGWHEGTKGMFRKCRKWMCRVAAVSVGLFVGVFSPSFGIGIILVYFILLGERINQELFNRVLRTSEEGE